MFTITSLLAAGYGALLVNAQSNPIKTASSSFVGFRNSTNTQTVRDLGFMGSIDGTYILSFGDGTPTYNISTFNQSAPVGSPNGGACGYLSARDGGGYQSDDPLKYADITVIKNVGSCGDVPQMGYFCPHIDDEENAAGLGITNVMQVNTSHGCIWTRPTKSGSDLSSAGAGLALVTLESDGTATCTRPFGKTTWSDKEPDWGQLTALDGRDGYTYVFANGYNGNVSTEISTVVLARAPTADVFDLPSYEYWHGSDTGFTKDRIYAADLSWNSPENLDGPEGIYWGQGSTFYSDYYSKFVFINNGNSIFNSSMVYAWTADKPQGPWSEPVQIYKDDYPQVTTGPTGFEYGGYIMPKFTSDDGKQIYYSFTRGSREFVITTIFQ